MDSALGESDIVLLREACRTADTLEAMANDAAGQPAVLTGRFGQALPNPFYAERQRLQRSLVTLFGALGLTVDAEAEQAPAAPRGRPRVAA